MKKLLIGFLVLSLVLLSFVSCNSNAITEADAVGSISFNQMQTDALKSLNATVTHLDKNGLYWRYNAVKMDNGGTSGQTEDGSKAASSDVQYSKPVVGSDYSHWGTGFDETHTFSVGTWKFTLYAFSVKPADTPSSWSGLYVYSGSISDATVVASTTKTVTIGVAPVSTGTALKGTLDFSTATKPQDAGYKDASVLAYKYKPNGGDETSWDTTLSYDVNPGSYTAYVGVFNTSSDVGTGSPLVTSSIAVTVYRGLTTNVGGSVDDQSGGVNFDPGVPTTEATITTSANPPAAATSPAVNITAYVSPSVVGSTTNHETVVDIPEGAINTTAGTTDTFKSELTVKSYAVDVASSTFQVKTSDDVAVAGIDCKMTVSINGAAATEVTDFQGSTPVTITTYILKNLESPKIYYDGDSSKAKPVAVNGASGQVSKETRVANGEIDVYESGDVPDGKVGYSKTTGKLVYTTTHFSTFHVEMNAEAYIKETNTAYLTVEGAVAAATTGQTVVMLKNADVGVITVDKAITIDGGNHTLTGTMNGNEGWGIWSSDVNHSGLLVTSDNVTVKNVTLTKMGNYAVIKSIGASTVIDNVKINNFSRMGIDINNINGSGASATIKNCYVDTANMKSSTGNAIQVEYGANVTITGTTVTNVLEQPSNWTSSGICVWDNSTVTVTGCILDKCTNAFAVSICNAASLAISGTTVTNTQIGLEASSLNGDNNYTLTLGEENNFTVSSAIAEIRAAAGCNSITTFGIAVIGGSYSANSGSNELFRIKDKDSSNWRNVINGTITVSGGTLYGPIVQAYQHDTDAIALVDTGITCTVNGGTFSADPSDYTALDYAVIKNSNDSSKYDVVTLSNIGTNAKTIVGGLFTNNPAASADDMKTALNYAVVKDDEQFRVVSYSGVTTNIIIGGCFDADPSDYVATGYVAVESSGVWTVGKAVASITKSSTTTYYASLASAVSAAESGNEITLLANITLTSDLTISKALTIEKNDGSTTHVITGEDHIKAGDGYAKTTSDTKIVIAVAVASVTTSGATPATTRYSSIVDAIVALLGDDSNEKITILKDVCVTSANKSAIMTSLSQTGSHLTVSKDIEVEISENAELSYSGYNYLFNLQGGCSTVKLSGDGSIKGNNGSTGAVFYVQNSSGPTVVVDGVTCSGNYIFECSGDVAGMDIRDIKIKSGYLLNIGTNMPSGNIKIHNGYFCNEYLTDGEVQLKVADYVTADKNLVATDGSDPAGYTKKTVAVTSETGNSYVVRSGNNVYFSDPFKALELLDANEIVILSKDINYSSYVSPCNSVAVTLDLNGKTVSFTGQPSWSDPKCLVLNGSQDCLTIKNGTITSDGYAMNVCNYPKTTKLVLDDVSVTASNIFDCDYSCNLQTTAYVRVKNKVSYGVYNASTELWNTYAAKYNFEVTGGEFNKDPSAYVPDGYVATQSGSTWTVNASI